MLTSLSDILREALLYLPLSVIGLWRWSYWVVRIIGARLYRPEHAEWPVGTEKPTVSIVTPVYNEDPEVFEQAMQSWIKNGVTEIVAVIDKSNTRHIVDFERRYSPRVDVACRLLVTPKPGKRAALCDGIIKAKGDIIALVDSDTIWGDGVLDKAIPGFLNLQVGGVTVPQRIHNPRSVSDVMFDILLWNRYRDEVPFLLGVGKVFNTLSGRTALYRRTALLSKEHDNIHALRHERFLGTRGISGDDKRLTHLILEQGWHIQFAKGAEVFTPGLGSLRKFLKQRLRWTRNSWRADLRAVGRSWVWRHPALAVFMIDRFIMPFVMLIGPVVFALAIMNRKWLVVIVLLVWWIASRSIRLGGYLRAHPKRVVYVPAYIVYGYVNAIMKVYALATLLEHSWATRWHKARMHKKLLKKAVPLLGGSAAVVVFFFGIYSFVSDFNRESGALIDVPPAVRSAEFIEQVNMTAAAPAAPELPAAAVLPTGVRTYTVRLGDTMSELAATLGMEVVELKKLNNLRDADKINVGMTLVYFESGAVR